MKQLAGLAITRKETPFSQCSNLFSVQALDLELDNLLSARNKAGFEHTLGFEHEPFQSESEHFLLTDQLDHFRWAFRNDYSSYFPDTVIPDGAFNFSHQSPLYRMFRNVIYYTTTIYTGKDVYLSNKASISREDHKDGDEVKNANSILLDAGRRAQPQGAKLVASVAIHFYETPSLLLGTHVYQFVTQRVGLANIEEGQCDVGLKELRAVLMSDYGREERKRK